MSIYYVCLYIHVYIYLFICIHMSTCGLRRCIFQSSASLLRRIEKHSMVWNKSWDNLRYGKAVPSPRYKWDHVFIVDRQVWHTTKLPIWEAFNSKPWVVPLYWLVNRDSPFMDYDNPPTLFRVTPHHQESSTRFWKLLLCRQLTVPVESQIKRRLGLDLRQLRLQQSLPWHVWDL